MFHYEQRQAAANKLPQKPCDLRDHHRVYPGHGLIEQNEKRIGNQDHPQLGKLSLSVGETAGNRIALLRQSNEVEDFRRVLFESAVVRSASTHVSNPQVLSHAHAGEHANALEGPADSEPRDVVRQGTPDRMTSKTHAPAVGTLESGQEIKQRRLVGAIGADDADCVSRRDIE